MKNVWIINEWLRRKYSKMASDVISSFHRDISLDNRERIWWTLLISSPVMILMQISGLIRTGKLVEQGGVHGWPNLLFVVLSVVLLVALFFVKRHKYRLPVWALRIPVAIFSLGAVSWAFWFSTTPVMVSLGLLLPILVMVLLSTILVLPLIETLLILLAGITGFAIAGIQGGQLVMGDLAFFLFPLVLTMMSFLSRMLYRRQLLSFVNWENITTMNETLKREIYKHMQTSDHLEKLTRDLDNQVTEKTRHLQEANQKLQEEIAERSYADKVRNMLYRISGSLNRSSDLQEVYRYVHEQLSQVMNVNHFMIGLIHDREQAIEPVFQVPGDGNIKEYGVQNTLNGMVINQAESLLVNQSKLRQWIESGEITISGHHPRSWLGVPLKVDDHVLGLIAVESRDASVRYDKTDQELLEYVAEHLSIAIERNLNHHDLILAKEKAEESDRLKSSFLANLSHEVRTPMNAIVGFAELICEVDMTAEERKFYSQQLLENGFRLLGTVTNMVEMAKIQSEQLLVDLKAVEAGELIGPLMEKMQTALAKYGKNHLSCTVNFEEEIKSIPLEVDFRRMIQVFECLSENAAKFTEEGGLVLSCVLEASTHVRFSLQDTGPGIHPDDLERIFQSFQKGIPNHARIYHGTGLGLTIANLLVEKMGGRIWAESPVGEGAIFHVLMPVYRKPAAIIQTIFEESPSINGKSRKASAG